MRKVIGGGIFMLCGILVLIAVYITTAIEAANLGSWTTPPGKFGTILRHLDVVPIWNSSIALMIVGAVFIVWGCFERDFGRLVKLIKRWNHE